MSGGLIGCFAAFALETGEMAGTKQGPSRDQVGTKHLPHKSTKLAPSQALSGDQVKRAVNGSIGPFAIVCNALYFFCGCLHE